MPEGWIKLHRKLLEWEWYQDPKMVHLFIHLLLLANHEPGKWQGVAVSRGQVITGLKSLQEATGLTIQNIRTCLGKLESTKELTSKSTNRFRVITLCNYEDYQFQELRTNKQLTNRQKLMQLNVQYEVMFELAKNTTLVSFEYLTKINKQINKQGYDVTTDVLKEYERELKEINKQSNKQLTNNQQATNKQLTANKNDKNDKNVKKKYSPTSDEVRLSTLLLEEIRKRKSNFREPNIQSWAKHIDLLLRLDKRIPEQVEEVIFWCQRDNFWQNNILSTDKLRKQIDKLELAMEKNKNGRGNKPVFTDNLR